MDDHFAKLYEKEGRQLLVTKGENNDGDPALCFRTVTRNAAHGMEFKVSFKGKTDAEKYEALDAAFNKTTEQSAWDIVDDMPGMDM